MPTTRDPLTGITSASTWAVAVKVWFTFIGFLSVLFTLAMLVRSVVVYLLSFCFLTRIHTQLQGLLCLDLVAFESSKVKRSSHSCRDENDGHRVLRHGCINCLCSDPCDGYVWKFVFQFIGPIRVWRHCVRFNHLDCRACLHYQRFLQLAHHGGKGGPCR